MLRDIAERTDGKLRLGTGTLYTALARLEALELVEEPDRRPAAAKDDERRRYYRLTPMDGRSFRRRQCASTRWCVTPGAKASRRRNGQSGRAPNDTPIGKTAASTKTGMNAASRIYSAALAMLPRRLRARYGDEMRATFAARAADADDADPRTSSRCSRENLPTLPSLRPQPAGVRLRRQVSSPKSPARSPQ